MMATILDDAPVNAIPRVDVNRFLYEIDTLAHLADWLRRQRAGCYAELVRKRQLSKQDAERDELARAAIAADWLAFRLDIPSRGAFASPPATRIWSMQQALAATEAHLRAHAGAGRPIKDYVDLRDAVASLLYYERDKALPRMLEAQAKVRGRRGR